MPTKHALGLPTYQINLLKGQVHRAMNRYLSRALEASQLSSSEWSLLGLLKDHEQLQPTEIAKHMDVKPPVTTVLLKHLDEMGLVQKQRHRDDNRFTVVSLTPKGIKLVDQLERKIQADFHVFTKGMRLADINAYLKVLKGLSSRLKRK